MRGKLLLVVGLAAGYVLGARAGRERYEDIKRVADKFWNSPRVQRQVRTVEDFARDKAPDVVGFLADGAKKVATQVSGTSRSTASGSTPAKGRAKPTAKKSAASRSGASTAKPASSE